MWINAKETKPDTSRKVFVRGTDQRDNVNRVVVACWHDFDNRWTNFIVIDNEYHTPSFKEITHWMEITDILSLPMQQEPTQEKHDRWYVPIGTISLLKEAGYNVKYAENWGYSPLRPSGHSITRGTCKTEMEAWYWCKSDYDWNKSNG